MLSNFGAVSSDIPALAFTEDLIKAYPEAKVVLVERDIDRWYQNFEEGIAKQVVSRRCIVCAGVACRCAS